MQVILVETEQANRQFLPLTSFRSFLDLRCGLFSLRQKWEKLLQQPVEIQTTADLQPLYEYQDSEDQLFIDGTVEPTQSLAEEILSLLPEEKLCLGTHIISHRGNGTSALKAPKSQVRFISSPYDLVELNPKHIQLDLLIYPLDFDRSKSQEALSIVNEKAIFIHQSAHVKGAFLNAENGPIIIEKNTVIQENTVLRGPCFISENSIVVSGAHLRNGVTIGTGCVVNGEIKQSIIQDYSNKAHYGYLGDSFVGSFVNLAAGTTTSNLKNTYSSIKGWDYAQQDFDDIGKNKAGSLIGDYVHTAIGTMLNAGTKVGAFSHLFDHEINKKHYKTFSWGESESYRLDGVLNLMNTMHQLKGMPILATLKELVKKRISLDS